jgi:cyclophilin family peptidyl-prolyl cis-trans isomerase/HEAT repeat protein
MIRPRPEGRPRRVGLGVLLLAAAAGCAHRGAPPPAPASISSPTPTPAAPPPSAPPRASTLSEIEPSLVSAEDRRTYDAPVLAAAAGSHDPAVRARAALALGRIGDERAGEPLRTLLADHVPAVREQAAFAAGLLGETMLSEVLGPLLADPDAAVASRAAWALGMLGQPAGRDVLVAAVHDAAAPGRRAAILRGLWRFGDEESARAAAPWATASDASVRTAALYVLARKPRESSLAILTVALADPDPQTAALCARALGILGKAESVGPLGAAVAKPGPPRIGSLLALAAILEKNPGMALPEDLRARALALSGDANPNVAVPALALLRWQVSDREAFRRLWTTATAGKERRQQVALQALMAGLGAGSDDLVDTAMASPDPFLRGAAAAALSDLPPADAAPRRQKLAEDPEVLVRLKVLEGLKTAADVSANGPIVERLSADADPGVRAAAIEAWALEGKPGLMAKLREAVLASYSDTAPDVPISALGAAEKSPESAEARGVAEAAYGHPSVLVSRLARRALVRTFHAEPARFPWRAYDTGRSVADYAALMAEARRPWRINVETARGTFTLRLDGATAPLTVMNCLALAGKEYFDGAPIHRIVPNFVVQDGDPTGTGNGGPGYEIRDELSALPYLPGTVGMALSGPDTGGSQWFVTQAPEPHLDGGYTVFGSVVSGMDVVLRLEQDDRILRMAATVGER